MIDSTSKTNRFIEAIEKYAEQQRSEMRAEIEAFREEQLAAANEEGTEAAFKFIQEQKREFKASLAKELAQKETQKKRELFAKREKMAEEVFEEASKRLTDFTQTHNYHEYMMMSARAIRERLGGRRGVAHISPKDKQFSSMVAKIIPGGEVVLDDTIRIGGISCVCSELSIVIDDTLDTKLEERKKLFVEHSGLMVE